MGAMRGDDRQPHAMFSYVSAEQRVPQDHPLRAIRALIDEVLPDMRLRRPDARAARHAASHAESDAARWKRDRSPAYPTRRVRDEPTRASADRTSVRLAENHRLDPEGETAWPGQRRLAAGVRKCGLQPDFACPSCCRHRHDHVDVSLLARSASPYGHPKAIPDR